MTERRAYLDRAPGETRGVVTLDGEPERLLIEREGDLVPRLGAVYAARVLEVSARLGLARLDLGHDQIGSLRLRGVERPPDQGRMLRAAVVAEPFRGKPGALAFSDGDAGPSPGLIAPAPSAEAWLQTWAGDPETGDVAREQADRAEAAALEVRQEVAPGLSLTIEPTAALVAVDVDLEPGAALSVARANLRAIPQAARLLRLKALGGLAVIDLVGFPKDRRRLLQAGVDAFTADGPQSVVGGIGRFGTLDVVKPHQMQPVAERLLDADGRPSARTVAQALVRGLERQGDFNPGRRLTAVCVPEVAVRLRPFVERLGPRFAVREALGLGREQTDILIL